MRDNLDVECGGAQTKAEWESNNGTRKKKNENLYYCTVWFNAEAIIHVGFVFALSSLFPPLPH